jgi:hypothetical protein
VDVPSGGARYSVVTGRPGAEVGLPDQLEAGVLICIFLDDGVGAIGGAVVYADDFELPQGLVSYTVKAFTYVLSRVVYGDYDGQDWFGHVIIGVFIL